ncbi:MAG: sugar kinase [Elusimicrobia bacterium]|nr:sugar kinase [Elusimicrobiota bacterium]
MPAFDQIVVITKKTALDELVERFNSRDQARFYVEHMGASFSEYQASHDAYQRALELLRRSLPGGVRAQFVERQFLPTFLFGESDLVATLGPDGLVANTAKYLKDQPLLALNPDARRVDGILVPFSVEQAPEAFSAALSGGLPARGVTMAKASLNDGQTLYAINDLFIGPRSHVSARYRITFCGRSEDQSSSGLIVTTGAGSTGWFRSLLTGAAGLVDGFTKARANAPVSEGYRFDWEADLLYFTVREPFVSKTSKAGLVFGRIEPGRELELVSYMPQNGLIFSDGIEADCLEFNSSAIARIGLAERKLNLLVPARVAELSYR